MKTYKEIIEAKMSGESPRRDKEFRDKHVIQKINHPVAGDDQFAAPKIKKDKTKHASHHDGEDAAVYEEVEQIDEISQDKLYDYHAKAGADLQAKRKKLEQGKLTMQDLKKGQNRVAGLNRAADKMHEEMSDAEMKKREDIVKGMKKNKADFQKRYGDRWKSVMYATATKAAMKEEVEQIDEISTELKKRYVEKGAEDVVDRFTSRGKYERPRDPSKYTKTGRPKKSAVNSPEAVKYRAKLDNRRDIVNKVSQEVHGKKRFGEEFVQEDWRDAYWKAAMKKEKQLNKIADADRKKREAAEAKAAAKKAAMKESVDLDEDVTKMSHGRLKWHVNTGVPHGSYTKAEMKAERDRRLKTGEGEAYKKAKPGLNEETYLDETFKAGLMKLKDGSSVTVTSEQASTLNALFNELNSSNQKKMQERLMSTSNNFNEILSFAKAAL